MSHSINKSNCLMISIMNTMQKEAFQTSNHKESKKLISSFKIDIQKVCLIEKIGMHLKLKNPKKDNKYFKKHQILKVVILKNFWVIFKNEDNNLKRVLWKEKNLLNKLFQEKEII